MNNKQSHLKTLVSIRNLNKNLIKPKYHQINSILRLMKKLNNKMIREHLLNHHGDKCLMIMRSLILNRKLKKFKAFIKIRN